MIRVAHVLPWVAVGGGVEQGTLRLARAVSGRGIESVAYCLPAAEELRQAFAASGHATAEYEGTLPMFRRPAAWIGASRRLASDLRSRRIDILHCSDLLAVYYAGLAGTLARIPVLAHVRCRFDTLPARDRILLRTVDHWVFVSRETLESFAYRVPDGRSSIVYDGIEFPEVDPGARASARAEFGLSDATRIIGMVARIAPAKDYETLIRAAALIIPTDPDVHFLAIGEYSASRETSEYYHRIRQMVADAGLSKWFTFTGHRTDVARLISAMDMLVLCSHGEGLPLSLMEGMVQGRPVLATAVGGIPELVLHERTGLLHAPGDDAMLASQIGHLLSDETRMTSLGRSGQEFVRAHFGVERFAADMESVYRKLHTRRVRRVPLG